MSTLGQSPSSAWKKSDSFKIKEDDDEVHRLKINHRSKVKHTKH